MNDFFNYFWIIIVNISAIIVVMILILKIQINDINYKIQQLNNDILFLEICDSLYWLEEDNELDKLENDKKAFV